MNTRLTIFIDNETRIHELTNSEALITRGHWSVLQEWSLDDASVSNSTTVIGRELPQLHVDVSICGSAGIPLVSPLSRPRLATIAS